jgi:septum formation protein
MSIPANVFTSPPQYEFIYLASQSPRRQELLGQVGVRFELLLPSADENAEALETPLAGERPTDYVQRVTRLKLDAAVARFEKQRLQQMPSAMPLAPILCADTTVSIGAKSLGKPIDHAHATEMLKALSGKSHRVLTAVAVATPNESGFKIHQALSASRVRFSRIKSPALAQYVATGESMGKAGAYAIQGQAAEFIRSIEGSYSGIMGLPLFETLELLGPYVRRYSR